MNDNRDRSAMSLVDRLCVQQRRQWLAGRRVPVELLFERHPSLRGDANAAFELVYNEYLVREELGESLDAAEFIRRFPEFAERFQRQLALHQALDSPIRGNHSFGSIPSGSAVPPSGDAEPFRGTERFTVLKRLGVGGMGAVYAAWDEHWQQKVALKTLHATDPVSNERLKGEFRMLTDLVHPNLVQLYELFVEQGRYFFTMELVEGREFSSDGALVRNDHAPLRDVLRQLAAGLHFLHLSGRLHCDLKPSNVLVTSTGRVVILDFGLARWSSRGGGELGSGTLQGTLPYLAPEVLRGGPASTAGDWYSIGVILHVALTGGFPFAGTAAEIIAAKQAPPRSPAERDCRAPADLCRLCLRLLDPNPSRRPGGAEVLESLGEALRNVVEMETSTDRDPFVGRKTELSRLWDAFRRAERGEPAGILVLGASGVGKTTLVRRFLRELADVPETLVLSGRCYERESIPFKAVDAAIEALYQHLNSLPREEIDELLPDEVPVLVRMFPALAPLRAVFDPRGESGEPSGRQELRQRAFGALRQLLLRLGKTRRIVLYLDDLQWGDADSADLLAELTGATPVPPLLLIACSRRGEVESNPCVSVLQSPASRGGMPVEELALENLSQAEALALSRQCLGNLESPAHEQVEIVARQSDGNPFLLLELARWLPKVAGRELSPEAIGSDALVQSRAEQLPQPTQRLLHVICVAGHPLGATEACRAARLEADPQKAVGRLRAERLIRTHRLEGPADQVEPYHDRIGEVIRDALSGEETRQYHRSLALALEADDQPDPERLALHYHEANVPERASRYAELAAARSAEALAFEDAARLYRLALQTHSGDRARELVLRIGLADALANAGRGAESAEEYLRAARLGSNQESRQLRRLAAEQYLRSGLVELGYLVLEPILHEIGVRLPQAPWAKLLTALALDRYLQWRGAEFVERPSAEIPDEQRERMELCWTTALAGGIYDYRRGFAFQTLHLLHSLRAGDARQTALGLHMQSGFVAGCGSRAVPRALQLLEKAEAIGRRLGDSFIAGRCELTHGYISLLEGRWRNASDHLSRAIQIFQDSQVHYLHELAFGVLYQSCAYFYLGEFGILSDRCRDLLPDVRRRGNLLASHWLRTGYSNAAWLAQDQVEEAQSQLERSIRECPPQPYSPDQFFHELADLHRRLYAGERQSAWIAAQESWRRVRRSGVLGVGLFRIQTHFLRACCGLTAVGDGLSDRKLLRQVRRDARKLKGEEIPWAEPMAQLLQAQVAFLSRDLASAVVWLRRTLQNFEDAEMGLYAAATRYRLGQLIGGQEGRHLVHAARAWMNDQAIRNPERMASMLAPGFSRVTEIEPDSG